jgi:hypothetical protein
MPPRYTYWTILFGDKPTAFRAATQEELLPTFGQIRGRHPDAVMMWFARGKLWRSEEEGRAAFAATHQKRGQPPFFAKKGDNLGRPPRPPEDGRPRDFRGPKPEWRDRPQGDRPRGPQPEWRDKPRDDNRPHDQRPPRPQWQNRDRPKTQDGRPQDFRGPKPPASARRPGGAGYGEGGEWHDRPKGDRPRGPKPAWRDKPRGGEGGEWRNKPRDDNRPRDQRPPRPPGPPASARKPTGPGYGGAPPKPAGGEGGERRGRDWRPGGEHKDPRDRFKVPRDVKRARFKAQAQRDRTTPRPPRKKKDEE